MIMTDRGFQIEFERRLQLMDPNLVIKDKLSSDTIISSLMRQLINFIKQDTQVLTLKLKDLNRQKSVQMIYVL